MIEIDQALLNEELDLLQHEIISFRMNGTQSFTVINSLLVPEMQALARGQYHNVELLQHMQRQFLNATPLGKQSLAYYANNREHAGLGPLPEEKRIIT